MTFWYIDKASTTYRISEDSKKPIPLKPEEVRDAMCDLMRAKEIVWRMLPEWGLAKTKRKWNQYLNDIEKDKKFNA